MQRSRTNPSCAADVWSHVNNVFGRDIHKHSVSMDSAALNSINNHFQTVAISSDHESAILIVLALLFLLDQSAVILLCFLRFLSHQCIFIYNILMLRKVYRARRFVS